MRKALLCTCATVLLPVSMATAGVVNPNISVIGQPYIGMTNDPESPDRDRLYMDIGETEFQFDDYLNPYSRGTIILSLADESLELEEGYFTLLRGLPAGLTLKGGKYRVGFGHLNMEHPHALPFAERFRVLAAYLPGDEAFNETGLSVSKRLPAPGDMSLDASLDWLQGNSFRREREVELAQIDAGDPVNSYDSGPDRTDETRAAFVGRISGFVMAGERSGIEFGVSATQGTNNVAAQTRTRVFDADVKAKLWNSPQSYLVLQGELLKLDREDATWDPETGMYMHTTVSPAGGYVFADYNFNIRYNVGASYEGFQADTPGREFNQAFGLFAGFSLMEETTLFQLDWSHYMPGTPAGSEIDSDAVDTLILRMIYSMGPHKAHQF